MKKRCVQAGTIYHRTEQKGNRAAALSNFCQYTKALVISVEFRKFKYYLNNLNIIYLYQIVYIDYWMKILTRYDMRITYEPLNYPCR